MKLVSIHGNGDHHPGVVLGAEILDIRLATAVIPGARLVSRSIVDIIEAQDEGLDLVRRIAALVEGKPALADRLRQAGALEPREQVHLAAPLPWPKLILSCGTNYREHLKEFNVPQPTRPGTFIKYSGSVIGTGEPIILPPSNPDLVDFEAELCVVFGRPCHQVSECDAMDHVLGYTLINDVSARDWVSAIRAAKNPTEANQAVLSNTLGKCFPTFAPLGPTIVTKDEMPDPHAIRFQSVLNGQVMQNGDTSDFIFSIPWLIAEFSRFFRFQPGDVVTTGSPPGVGLARNPPVLLRDGSVVEVRNDRIGSLINPVKLG